MKAKLVWHLVSVQCDKKSSGRLGPRRLPRYYPRMRFQSSICPPLLHPEGRAARRLRGQQLSRQLWNHISAHKSVTLGTSVGLLGHFDFSSLSFTRPSFSPSSWETSSEEFLIYFKASFKKRKKKNSPWTSSLFFFKPADWIAGLLRLSRSDPNRCSRGVLNCGYTSPALKMENSLHHRILE